MKRIFLLIVLLPLMAAAQHKPLVVEGVSPDLYITHTVAPKENYYSIGRLYNVSPKEIAPYNKLELDKGLNLNQVIKVPLSANFSQDGVAAADEALVPVYHVVKDKEGLYRIGTNYNKLPVATLKKWNNIPGDAVASGTKLIVGYIKVKKDLSALSSTAKPAATVAAGTAPAKENPLPDVAKETEKKTEPKPVAKEKQPTVVKAEEIKPKAVDPEPEKKESPVVKAEPKNTAPAEPRKAKNFNGGYFKAIFTDQAKNGDISNETGTAAVFKSTSGWDDGKYYCLHNNAVPGSVVKITDPSSGKSVYAKVLDVMPDIKQNEGVLIRLSNAAAAELGQGDNKFDCTISFSR